jgi:hypothetical protein
VGEWRVSGWMMEEEEMRVGVRTYVDFFRFCFDDGYLARFVAG